MKVALVFPPTCDPTSPYLSVPSLLGFLREHGVDVVGIDANIEAWLSVLRPAPLRSMCARVEHRLGRLERSAALSHVQQLAYSTLFGARGEALAVQGSIDDALEVLRDRSGRRFYDPVQYDRAVRTVEGALRVVCAAHAPLDVGFARYRTPFGLMSPERIAADARAERDPFHEYTRGALLDRLRGHSPGLVGFSVAFSSQLQPAYSMAAAVREAMPGVHLCAGGPAMTQLLVRQGSGVRAALGPFDTAILFEGEEALLGLVRDLEAGRQVSGVIRGETATDIRALPAPDFGGMPLDAYLSPEPVLPYDATRGCYWGRCAFCHYGLSERGVAPYRERGAEICLEHLRGLASAHGARIVLLSQDTIAPRALEALARLIRESGLPVRWATDVRPERGLTPERCRTLASGGGLAVSVGIESGSERVLALMDKGIRLEHMTEAVRALADAGIAVVAMCFTGFPTETAREVRATVRWLGDNRDRLCSFMCGEFGLTHGSRVAACPGEFGVRETYVPGGDALGTCLCYVEEGEGLSNRDKAASDAELARVASAFAMRPYPFAGSLSTAHSLLYVDRYGPAVFRDHAGLQAPPAAGPSREVRARFDVGQVAATSARAEAAIWAELCHERRSVTPADYRDLASRLPAARPKPGRWRVAPGREPERVR